MFAHFAESASPGLGQGGVVGGEIVFVAAGGIDDGDAFTIPDADETGGGIGLMDVAVEHNGGVILAEEGAEAFEAAMGEVRLVAQTGDRGMGEEDIKAAGLLQLPPEVRDAAGHFLLGIHAGGVRTISHGTAEAEDAEPAELHDVVLRADAAFGWFCVITVIMIAVDINHRGGGEAGHIGEIRRGEIAAGEDQVRGTEGLFSVFAPEAVDGFIGKDEDMHRMIPLCWS